MTQRRRRCWQVVHTDGVQVRSGAFRQLPSLLPAGACAPRTFLARVFEGASDSDTDTPAVYFTLLSSRPNRVSSHTVVVVVVFLTIHAWRGGGVQARCACATCPG